jgi:uncharacterized protein GlcG (DUF336 family)
MFATTKYITLEAAKKMMTAAEAEARKNNWTMAIAIVDAAGNLILFEKMDDTQPGSIGVAIGKARTSANFKRPTKALDDAVMGGRIPFLAVEGVVPMGGGLPVIVDGKVIGSIAASGGTAAQDEEVARAGLTEMGLA